jgi:hypothetical protein
VHCMFKSPFLLPYKKKSYLFYCLNISSYFFIAGSVGSQCWYFSSLCSLFIVILCLVIDCLFLLFFGCIFCSGTCRTSFHPICAREAKFRMEVWGKYGCDNVSSLFAF